MVEVIAAANEALGLLISLRDLSNSLKIRITNYSENPGQLRSLKDELSSAEQKINWCSETLESYCKAISTESLKFEVIDHQGIMRSVQGVVESVDQLDKKLLQRPRFFREFSRAKKTARIITQLVEIVRDMNNRLDTLKDKLKEIAEQHDFFRPDFSSVPKLRTPVYLDFSTGSTIEGKLKAEVLKNTSQSASTLRNQYGHGKAVVGVSGMGGIGKTTAVLGLAQDADVREKFSEGGIYFLVVGKDATPDKLVANLKAIVRGSGGKRLSEEIDCAGSLESAITAASSWFAGRTALFILDDIWQTSTNQTGYSIELTGLLDDCPNSHVIISTRSNIIASETSSRIEFRPRESTGSEARGMFLASANIDETMTHDSMCGELVEEVLELCGGVPMMLSIAGAQVRRRNGTHIASLKRLLSCLKEEHMSLPEQQPANYPSCFNQAVEASLNTIANALQISGTFKMHWDEYCRSNPTRSMETIVEFVIDCFRRLCILPRSVRVSEKVIYGIWGGTYKRIGWSVLSSLADFHLLLEIQDVEGNTRYGLHDVILDYCQQVSRFGQTPKYEVYHQEFLRSSWKRLRGAFSSVSEIKGNWESFQEALPPFWLPEAFGRSLPWWKIFSSSKKLSEIEHYLLQNLFRHLQESSRLGEAVGLLSHIGWTKLCVAQGGINALNADFSFVTNAIRSHPAKEHEQEACAHALRGIMSIWNMVGKAWPLILKNSEGLATHAHGHLLDEENKLVERYLVSAVSIESGPWLKPKKAFWRMLDSSGSQRAFHTAEWVVGIAFGSRNVIAATKDRVFWIDRESMRATREMVIGNKNECHSQITAICLCESQGILVLAFSSGELELRNKRDGNILRAIPEAHEDRVTGVAISSDGRTLVSGSLDKTVRLWDVVSGTRIGQPLYGHNDSVRSVGISGDGQIVVSGSDDKMVRLWDARTGAPMGEPLCGHEKRVKCVAISGDGRTVVSGSLDNTVRLWDAGSGTRICRSLHGHKKRVKSVSISTDGRTVVSGADDKTVRLWDVESGTPLGQPLRGHDNVVLSVSISGDGRTVMSSAGDKTVRLWNVESRTPVDQPLREYDSYVFNVAISEDGRTAVSGYGDGMVRLWDVGRGTRIGQLLHGQDTSVVSVAISRGGQIVVCGSTDNTLRLWDAGSGTPIGEPLLGHADSVRGVAISGDGQTVVSGSLDKTLRLWDVKSGTKIGEPLHGHDNWVRTVAISGDGRTIVSGSADKTARLWDVKTGTPIGEPLCGHGFLVKSVAISSDGRTVVSGSFKTIRLWDVGSGKPICQPLHGHEDWVRTVGISANGETVVSVSEDGFVVLWSRNASGTDWNRSGAWLLPISKIWGIAFADGEESSGVMARLVCPLLEGALVFELRKP